MQTLLDLNSLNIEAFLRASCLMLEINEFRCYEAKIEESEKGQQPPGVEPRTPGLSCQCSATELRQPDNHQPSQSSICTAQVVLNASVAHLAATGGHFFPDGEPPGSHFFPDGENFPVNP